MILNHLRILRQRYRNSWRSDRFLPPGPWIIESLEGTYYASENADPGQILHGVGVAIDPSRMLNNANPVKVCVQLQLADLQPGETVFHVGAGYGYFSALMAELVEWPSEGGLRVPAMVLRLNEAKGPRPVVVICDAAGKEKASVQTGESSARELAASGALVVLPERISLSRFSIIGPSGSVLRRSWAMLP